MGAFLLRAQNLRARPHPTRPKLMQHCSIGQVSAPITVHGQASRKSEKPIGHETTA
jgi:hypothetical protein